MVGIDPRPLTLRQLWLMSEGKFELLKIGIKHDWECTSELCAVIANCHRDPKKSRVFKAADFNPYAEKQAVGNKVFATKANIMSLKPALMAMKNKNNVNSTGVENVKIRGNQSGQSIC